MYGGSLIPTQEKRDQYGHIQSYVQPGIDIREFHASNIAAALVRESTLPTMLLEGQDITEVANLIAAAAYKVADALIQRRHMS